MTDKNSEWFEVLGNLVPYNRRARAIEEAEKLGLELNKKRE